MSLLKLQASKVVTAKDSVTFLALQEVCRTLCTTAHYPTCGVIALGGYMSHWCAFAHLSPILF
mgnify:CR=1 FL=1